MEFDMPASSINLYQVHDAKNNFNNVRPVPICTGLNNFTSQRQNIPVSTNCYYGYDHTKIWEAAKTDDDCEMVDIPATSHDTCINEKSPTRGEKRRAEDGGYSYNKRRREEVLTKKNKEPETTEKVKLETRSEEFLNTLYWNLHGGSVYYCVNV